MDEKKWAAVLVAVVVIGAGSAYYFTRPAPVPPPAETPPVAAAEAPPPAPAPPPADYPVPDQKPDLPALPALAESDVGIRGALSDLVGKGSFEAFLIPDMLIRRIVVTIDNLPRDRLALPLRPFKRTPPPVLVRQDGSRILLSPENSERYSAAVTVFTAIDAGKLVALYFRWYPLFQRAYADLGYPDRSFNNRLVEVIDHLLATPEPPAEIELVQPKVAYEFADPQLESLSSGEKMLLRMNEAQRNAVKTQLKAVRAAVVGGAAATVP
jgi:hypothetical protein